MKFALVNNERREATPKMQGICPVCNQPVIAKCGEYKINHWAHKVLKDCDKWWESEQEWHRNWKNQFDTNWQEIIMHDPETGEKHVADIKTPDGLVVEFQHSSIKPEEQRSRENFYKKMVWVVDGTRCPSYNSRFCNNYPIQIANSNYFRRAQDAFPRTWLDCTVPVIMDFGVAINADEDWLYCLFPKSSIMLRLLRQTFIQKVKNGTWYDSVQGALSHVNAYFERQKAMEKRDEERRRRFYEILKYKRIRDKFSADTGSIEPNRADIIKRHQRNNIEMPYEDFKIGVMQWLVANWGLDDYTAMEFIINENVQIQQIWQAGGTAEIAGWILANPNL